VDVCNLHAAATHMKSSSIRSSFFLIEGRFPQAQISFVIFPTKLLSRRFLCTK